MKQYANIVLSLCILITFPVAAACENGRGAKPGALAQNPKNYSPVSMTTWPGADCLLHPEGNNDPAATIPVFADDDGMAEFHAVRSSAGDSIQRLVLDCHDETGRSATYPVDLQTDATFVHHELARKQPTRPALSGDPLQYSQSELIQAGFGIRPNPETNPKAYAHWLKAASVPARQVISKGRATGANATIRSINSYGNWGGPVLTSGIYAGTYETIQVPTAIPGGDGTIQGGAAMWGGIGGYNSTPSNATIIQSGVQIFTNPTSASYWAVIEYCCGHGGGYDSPLGYFQVRPNDQVYSEAWACDVNGSLNLKGGYGCFYLVDENTGAYASCTNPWGSCPSLSAAAGMVPPLQSDSAEFINEKDQPYLADYFCCATITGEAFDANLNFHSFYTDNVDLLQMFGWGGQLEFARILSSDQVLFSFNERAGGR